MEKLPIETRGVVYEADTKDELEYEFAAEKYETFWPWSKPWKLRIRMTIPNFSFTAHLAGRYSEEQIELIMRPFQDGP